MNKKIFKYIICFFSILSIVTSPALVTSVSAEVNDNVNDPSMNGFNVSNLEISIKNGNGENLVKSIYVLKLGTGHYRYEISCSQNLVVGSEYTVEVNLIPSEPYITSEYFVLGEFTWLILRNGNFTITDYDMKYNYRNFSSVDYSYQQNPDKCNIGITVDNYPYFTTYYNTQTKGTKYEFYHSVFNFKVNNSNTSTLNLYLNSLYFNLIHPETAEIISNQDKNTDSILKRILDLILAQKENTEDLKDNEDENTDRIIENQNENTDKIINAGEDVDQPDFDNTNDSLDNTTKQMKNIEGEYKLDKTSTQKSLNEGKNFIMGTDMQKASVQVKNWIEKFGSDNVVISGFLVACMVLGVCFWVIGRKSW